MRSLFYFLYGAFGLLGVSFVLSSLFGYGLVGAKLFLLGGAMVGGAVLYWAYQLGEQQARWGAGAGAVGLAVVAFQLTQVVAAVAVRR